MKQNELIDASKIAKQRADRLRRLRNLSNLSRKELCDGSKININTYIGYEVARYGGLTEKGAEKIIRYISTKGVSATVNWLMYNLGANPQLIPVDQDIEKNAVNVHSFQYDSSREFKKISTEIQIFHDHYPHAIDYCISDDGMSPRYAVGDFVAGILYSGNLMKSLVGLDCIVKTKDGQILVRNVYAGKIKGRYTLVCSNPHTTCVHPVMHDVEVMCAAHIIWHRKPFKKEKNNVD